MKKGKTGAEESKGLRARAEKDLKKKVERIQKESKGDFKRAIHELHVHQVELEMQNEELRRAQQEIEDSRNKYSDLYDFAPVGYFTFDKTGLIIEANLAGCQMLGVERANLIKKLFRLFVDKESQDDFYLHRQAVSRSNTKQSCEITLVRKDKTTLDVQLESIPAVSADGKLDLCRTAITDIAERKNVERLKEAISQQAIEERNRLEAVMEALPTGVAIIDTKGGNLESNAAFENVWGGPRPPTRNIKDYAKYKAWWAATGKPVKPEEWASAVAIQKGKTVFNQLFEIQRFDGSRVFVLNSAAPIRDAGGEITGSAVAIRDITKLREAEEAVSRSQKTFSELVERAPFGIYVVDSQFRITHMNVASQNGAFQNVRPLIGRPFNEAMHILWPDDVAEGIIAHFRHTLDKGQPFYSPRFTNLRHDVEIVESYEWELHRMTLPDGQYGVICYYFDSTKLRDAEDALRRSEGRWNAALENFDVGAIIATEAEQVIYWNPTARAMHGFKSENEGIESLEDIPKTFELWTPDGAHMLVLEEWPMRRIKRGEKVRNLELRLRRPDQGWEKIVSYSGEMVETAGGERLIFLSVYDITEQRKAEEALKQIRAELERSNKELADFAQITSHDLREPLRAISGFIQLLDQRYKDKLDEKGNEYIKYATGGAKKLEELLNGLLEYSRVQTRGQRVVPLPAGLALREAIKNLQKSIDETGASITFDELPDVNADGSQLTRVFQNLIDNAIKFRDKKKPQIHISCQKNENRCQFSVRDNGNGIDPQHHERIFKIFQRLHSQGQYPGYGIGLTVCRKIVERHGGRIWVESEKGKGSTFHFTI